MAEQNWVEFNLCCCLSLFLPKVQKVLTFLPPFSVSYVTCVLQESLLFVAVALLQKKMWAWEVEEEASLRPIFA